MFGPTLDTKLSPYVLNIKFEEKNKTIILPIKVREIGLQSAILQPEYVS